MNDPDFKPRKLPPLPTSVRPVFAAIAGLALLFGLGLLIYAFVAAPHGARVQ